MGAPKLFPAPGAILGTTLGRDATPEQTEMPQIEILRIKGHFQVVNEENSISYVSASLKLWRAERGGERGDGPGHPRQGASKEFRVQLQKLSFIIML